MALVGVKVLSRGQITSAGGNICDVAASKEWIVKYINLSNSAAGPVTVDLYINGSTAAYHWRRVVLSSQYEGWEFTRELFLADADFVYGIADINNQVNYVFAGLENA